MEAKDALVVTLVQTDLFWEDTTANLAALEEKIAGLTGPVDLLILPEMFSTGFTMAPRHLAEPMNLRTTRWMQQIATNTGALVLGSFAAREDVRFHNRLMAVKPDGTYQHYDKRHLFRMGGEHEVYSGGDTKLIVEWKGWRICPLVCYDLRFPVWSRNRPAEAYDLLVYVANWPAPRSNAWDTLLCARAIENQAFVAGVNRVGTDGKGVNHRGGSALIDYFGQPVALAGEKEQVITGEIQLSRLRAYREKFPAYLDADPFELKG